MLSDELAEAVANPRAIAVAAVPVCRLSVNVLDFGFRFARCPERSWNPYGDGHIVIRRRVACRNCFLSECTVNGLRCLDEIDVEEVWSACQRMLAAARRLGLPVFYPAADHREDGADWATARKRRI